MKEKIVIAVLWFLDEIMAFLFNWASSRRKQRKKRRELRMKAWDEQNAWWAGEDAF